MLSFVQMTKQSKMEQCTAVRQCMLTTYGKALISVAHLVTSVTNTCQCNVLLCLNMTHFECQKMVPHRLDNYFCQNGQKMDQMLNFGQKI